MLHHLKNLGLSDKEARVYLAMLELGPAPMLEIAAKAGVNRPTAYVQIESLKKRGLVSTQTKGNRHLFVAESPDQLETLLEREQKVLEQKTAELAKVLPELQTLFNLTDEKPHVRFFEGKEGLLKIQREFLKASEGLILGITAVDDVLRVFPDQLRSYTPERLQRKIRSRVIYTSQRGDFLKEEDQRMLRETKFVPPGKFSFTADITIFDEKVAIMSLRGKLSGIIIVHREIADSFRGLFNLTWGLL